jgi:hypothetical protein
LEACEEWATTNTLLFGSLLGAGLELPLTDLLAPPPASPPTLTSSSTADTAPSTTAPPPALDLLALNGKPSTLLDEPPATHPAATPDASAPAVNLHDPGADPFGIFIGFGQSDDAVTPARHVPVTSDLQPPPTGVAVPSPVAFRAESAAAPAPAAPGATAGPAAAAAPVMIAPIGRAAIRDGTAAPRSSGSGGGLMMMDDTGGGGPVGDPITETALLVAPGDQEVQVTATVTIYPDHFLWQYDVHNLSYVGLDETDPSTADVAHFIIHADVPDIADTANTLGWIDYTGVPTWAANDKNNLLPPGESGSFSFTTPICAIDHVGAEAGEADDNFEALGWVLGPVFNPVPMSLTMPGGQYVPVNANDDNGSAIAYEIPTTRDFNFGGPLPLDTNDPNGGRLKDPELQEVDVWVNNLAQLNGQFVLTTTQLGGPGQIRLWTDQSKSAEIPSGTTYTKDTLPTKFFVEGLNPTTATQTPTGPAALPDNRIRLMYLGAGGFPIQFGTTAVDVAVTPVVTEFLTWTGTWGVITRNGKIVGVGTTNVPNDVNRPGGMTFRATVDRRNVPGSLDTGTGLIFIQNAG